MSKIQWFEGHVSDLSRIDADPTNENLRLVTAQIWPDGTEFKVQLDQNTNQQMKLGLNDKIMFYTDSNSNAKFGFKLADALPHSSPIWLRGDFQSGEVGIAARGTIQGGSLVGDAGLGDISDGAYIWLRNNGDGHFCSGSGLNSIEVSDDSKSIDIKGQNVDIYAQGNFLTTHAINIDCSSLGITTLNLGVRNPFTGLWVTRLTCETDGSWGLGAFDPLLGIQLGGFAYNLLPKLPLGPFLPNTCKITSIPYISQVTTDPLGTSINGQVITIAGTATPIPGSLPLPAVEITLISANVGIVAVATEILGLFNVTGNVSIEGAVEIAGETIIGGNVNIIGLTTISGQTAITSSGAPPIVLVDTLGTGAFVYTGSGELPAVAGFIFPQGFFRAIVNGKPVKIPYYL